MLVSRVLVELYLAPKLWDKEVLGAIKTVCEAAV